MPLNSVVARVTDRIRERSATGRSRYLALVDRMAARDRGSDRLGCANVAHAFAALPSNEKFKVIAERVPNIGIVTAYNDMLSAHAPYAGFPDVLKDEARKLGATAQVAGGGPAVWGGGAQGTAGLGVGLFSRGTIGLGPALALSPDAVHGAPLP